MLRVLGVYREREFSPGRSAADAAIIDAVLKRLQTAGAAVSTLTAAQMLHRTVGGFDLVLAMCQSEAALARLAALQQAGTLVINSPHAIRSCYRDRLGDALKACAAPVPQGVLVATAQGLDRDRLGAIDARRGVYVKRGDLHALCADDVLRVGDEAGLAQALARFAARGVRLAYVQAAVEGSVIKFYGVTGTGYFSVADAAVGVPAGLHEAAHSAAVALGLEVWGGDAIVNGQQFKLVDFNDWPSFERVRAQAADAIARRALHLMRERRPAPEEN